MRHILAFALLVCVFGRLSGQSAYFIMSDSTGCDSLQVVFTNDSDPAGLNMSYSWNFGNGQTSVLFNPPDILYKKPGLYTVTLKMTPNNASTSYTYSNTVLVKPRANANFFIADSFDLGELTYRFRSGRIPDDTSSYSYEWILNPVNGTYNYRAFHQKQNVTENGILIRDTLIYPFTSEGKNTMQLIVTDYLGCADTVIQHFVVSERLVVPKAFTPNRDGLNDLFIVPTNGRTKYSLQIFTPTGQMVFKSESNSIIWDGNLMNGSKAAPGNYLYIIEPISGGTAMKETGFVMLIRHKNE